MAAAAYQGTHGFGGGEPLSIGPATSALLVALGLFLLLNVCPAGLYSRRRRRKYPPVAGSVFHQLFHFSTVNDYQTELSARYGTYRLWVPRVGRQIYLVDPRNVEYILKTNFSNYGKGQINHERLKDLFGDGIFAVDGDKWRHQRKLASFEFSTKVLRDFSSNTFKSNAAKLARIVSEMSAADRPMDIQDLFLKSTMDSIFKVGFGVDLNSLDGGNERGVLFAQAFDDCSVAITRRYVDVLWKLKKLLNLGMEARLRSNLQIIDDFIYEIVRERKQQNSKSGAAGSNSAQGGPVTIKHDILSRFLQESATDPDRMTTRYLRDIIFNFLLAGKDTTAGSLAWFFYMMCKHPDVQQEVAQEVRRATSSAATSACGGTGLEDGCCDEYTEFASRLTQEALEKMHLLHAALSETLRIYPAVPQDPKVCFSDDVLPDGYDVRKGDIVVYQPYAMGRLKSLWGDDAEAFRPQRWLDENGQFRPENPFKFTAFQAGPRICLGKEFAYRQMKIFAALLLHFFSFRLADETKPAHYKTMITLLIDGGLHVCATPRERDTTVIRV